MHLNRLAAKSVVVWLGVLTACTPKAPGMDRGPGRPADVACAPSPAAPLPAPWSGAELATHGTWLEGLGRPDTIPPTPAVGELGAPLHRSDGERAELSMIAFFGRHGRNDLPRGERPVPVDVHDLWLRREPVAALQPDGLLTVRWETLRPLRAGRTTVGMHFYAGLTRTTVWRKTEAYDAGEPVTAHRASQKVGWIIDPTYDESGAAERGRGVLAFRVVMHDDDEGKAPIHDGEIGFRCEPVPCGAGARFVQLPAFRLGPFVDRVSDTGAVISFQTDTPTRAAVVLRGSGSGSGGGGGGDRRFASLGLGHDHEIVVSGLTPGRAYRYAALATDARGETAWQANGTLRTAPADPSAGFRFSILSDTRRAPGGGLFDYRGINRQVLEGLLAAALERRVAFVVVVGDLIDGATTVPGAFRYQLDGWRQVATPYAMHLPIYETMGNHEILMDAWLPGWYADRRGDGTSESLFAAAFVNPNNGPQPATDGAPTLDENVYSFDYGKAHFAVVNTDYDQKSHPDRDDHPAAGRGFRQGWVSDGQLAWLRADLTSARAGGAKHLFVLTHEPAFPNGGHAGDAMYWDGRIPEVLARRDAFWQILSDHGARAGLFGDEHNYSRLLVDAAIKPSFRTPVWSFITGGGGAPHYAQDKTLPWSDRVAAFSAHPHQVFFSVCGDRVSFEAVSLTGVVLDRGELTP